MLRSVFILACGLMVWSGCSTAPRRPATKPIPAQKVWELPGDTEPAPAIVPTNTPPAPAPSQPLITTTGEGWLPLGRWTDAHGFAAPQRLSLKPVERFAVNTPSGILRLGVKSQSATWDGVEIRLGFAPQLLEGQVYIHSLDLKKNLEPLLQSKEPLKTSGKSIVLDPGHGGSNPGTRSAADAQFEKQFTLDWALRTADLLRARGWNVILTRTNDTDVSLADRVTVAETNRADLFVSLHFNSSGGGHGQSGLETYCLTPQGMSSTLTRNYEDDPQESLPNNAFDEENLRLAVKLHRALLKVNGSPDRGVRRARFLAVLRGQNRPAALVEGGYLSNPAEARHIAQPEYRQRLAEAVANALE